MPKPIPDNIKEILGQLTGPQQVALRGYIATLRAEIKDLEADVLAKSEPDPHAHYHGHEKVSRTAESTQMFEKISRTNPEVFERSPVRQITRLTL